MPFFALLLFSSDEAATNAALVSLAAAAAIMYKLTVAFSPSSSVGFKGSAQHLLPSFATTEMTFILSSVLRPAGYNSDGSLARWMSAMSRLKSEQCSRGGLIASLMFFNDSLYSIDTSVIILSVDDDDLSQKNISGASQQKLCHSILLNDCRKHKSLVLTTTL